MEGLSCMQALSMESVSMIQPLSVLNSCYFFANIGMAEIVILIINLSKKSTTLITAPNLLFSHESEGH